MNISDHKKWYGPVKVKGIRMFGRITPVYVMPAGIGLCDGGTKRAGIYAFQSVDEVEFGSTGCLKTRFSQRHHTSRWATYVFWMELQKHGWLDPEYRFYIEAFCINFCCRTDFLGRRVRNYQSSKTMGRFIGANYAVGNLGVKFLHIIKRSTQSIDLSFNTAR